MSKNSLSLIILATVLLATGAAVLIGQTTDDELLTVDLGADFVLHENQAAKIKGEGLEIKVTQFHNSPCPTGARCIWSGIGISFEYHYLDEIQSGINKLQAFGYQTTVIESDHETFVRLKVEKP